MFGYVKVNKPECKIREYEYYKAVYCGLCRALGKCGGQCARLTLTYDFTFLALVHMALSGEKPSFYKKRCIAHPILRHAEAMPNASLDFCARASLMLTYEKLLDDIADERGKKRARARLLRALLRPSCRRAARGQAVFAKKMKEGLSALSELEKNPPISLDRPAMLFGELMAELLSYSFEGERAKIARSVGRAVGRWVYLIDALDDFEEDLEKGRYNPLVLVYGEKLDGGALSQLKFALDAAVAEASAALDLVEFPDGDMRALAENILHLGMSETFKEVMTRKEKACRE